MMTVTESNATRSLTLNGLTVTARIPPNASNSNSSTPENLSESDFYHELEIYQKLLRGDCENGSPKTSKCTRVTEGAGDGIGEAGGKGDEEGEGKSDQCHEKEKKEIVKNNEKKHRPSRSYSVERIRKTKNGERGKSEG